MLVVSRRVNEAVVLGDRVIITLARLLPNGVVLTIQQGTDGPSTLVELGVEECIDIELGVRLTLVDVRMAAVCPKTICGGLTARLGFEGPPTVPIVRKEVWDMIGPHWPNWYFPLRTAAEPSSN
jgi:sRNA-binding carbon storage regulator CsrA